MHTYLCIQRCIIDILRPFLPTDTPLGTFSHLFTNIYIVSFRSIYIYKQIETNMFLQFSNAIVTDPTSVHTHTHTQDFAGHRPFFSKHKPHSTARKIQSDINDLKTYFKPTLNIFYITMRSILCI